MNNKHATGGEASFIEGDIFKMIIPINHKVGGTNDGINWIAKTIDDVIKDSNKSVLVSLSNIAELIHNSKDGASLQEIIDKIKKSQATVERYLKILRDINIVEFKGAPKTGVIILP